MFILHGAAPNPGQSPQDADNHPEPPHTHISTSFLCSHTLQAALCGQPTLPKAVTRGAAPGCGGLDSGTERVPSARLKTEHHPGCTVLPLTQHHLRLCCTALCPRGSPEELELPRAPAVTGVVRGDGRRRAPPRKPAKPETTQTNTKQLKKKDGRCGLMCFCQEINIL